MAEFGLCPEPLPSLARSQTGVHSPKPTTPNGMTSYNRFAHSDL